MIIKNIPKTFIGFLLASFLIWLLITFSKEYTTSFKYQIKFTDIPQDKILEDIDNYQIQFTVKGTGFKLLRSKFGKKKLALSASNHILKNKDTHYVLVKKIKQELQNTLISDVELLEFSKDTIFVKMGVLQSKKVPLKTNFTLNFHKGYDLLNDLKIIPDSVLVSANKTDLDALEYIALNPITLNDIKTSFTKEVEISLPSSIENLNVNTKTVSVQGEVDKFTEGKVVVPLTIINLPDDITLTKLSDNIELSFVVALSKFAEVTPASFRVVADYQITKDNALDYLLPEVIQSPDFIKSYKISPHKIDFLIQK